MWRTARGFVVRINLQGQFQSIRWRVTSDLSLGIYDKHFEGGLYLHVVCVHSHLKLTASGLERGCEEGTVAEASLEAGREG